MRWFRPLMSLLAATACGCSASATEQRFAGAARPAMAALPIAETSAAPPVNQAERLLAAHNRHRLAAGVPPLVWDTELARGAASYGPPLARGRTLVHSPRSGRPGISENLWMGTAGAYPPEAMVENWAAERAQFRPGIFPNVSTTGNWLDVSHYTQMIWRGTTKVGCAIHRSGGWDYLICRYSPAGNRDGKRVP